VHGYEIAFIFHAGSNRQRIRGWRSPAVWQFALPVVDGGLLRYNQVEVKGMATERITIQVDREAARAYKAAPAADQRKMGALLSLWLKDVAMAEPAALKQMMTDLSKKARDRGLTPEILENLLKEA